MAFNGIYNIKLVRGSPTGNSAKANGTGVELQAFNPGDVEQRWTIRPASNIIPNAYTIESVAFPNRFIYAAAAGDARVWLRPEKYVWFFQAVGNDYRIFTDDKNMDIKFWLPIDDGHSVIITGNSTWFWNITPAA